MVDSDKLEVPAIQVEKLGYAGTSLIVPVPAGGGGFVPGGFLT